MKLSYTYKSSVFSTRDTDSLKKEDQEALAYCVEILAKIYGVHPKSIYYLLQNGWSQSLQDSYAGARAKAVKDGESEGVIDEVVLSSIEKRIKGLVEGLLSASGGGGRDPIKSVGLQMLQSFAAERGKTVPSDKEKRAKMLEAYIKQNREKIEAEIARRRSVKGDELDLDDLEVA